MPTTIRLTPDSKRLIERLAKQGKLDLRPSFNVIGEGYRKEVKAIFEKKQPRQAGLRWAPLSPAYAAWKEINYPGAPILVRTGKLKESMIRKGAPGNLTLIGKGSAVFGSYVLYGKFHDEGTTRLPQRNFSEPSDRRFAIWKQQLASDISKQLERNGISVDEEGILK